MLVWTILILGSIILGALISIIKWRYSWVIIFPVPIAIIHLLNNYQYYTTGKHPAYTDAPMSELAYIFAGIPSITISLITYSLIKQWRNKKDNDN